MSKSKVLIGAAFVLGGLLGLVPLFTLDKERISSRIPFVSQGSSEAIAAPASGDGAALGSFGNTQVQRNQLNGNEAQKLYEAEMQVYTAAEQILVQRYITGFFEKMKTERKLASAEEAQAAYFSERVKLPPGEVEKFLEENKDNPALQRIPQDQRAPQVRNYLEGRAREGAFVSLSMKQRTQGPFVLHCADLSSRNSTLMMAEITLLDQKMPKSRSLNLQTFNVHFVRAWFQRLTRS